MNIAFACHQRLPAFQSQNEWSPVTHNPWGKMTCHKFQVLCARHVHHMCTGRLPDASGTPVVSHIIHSLTELGARKS